MGAGFSQALEQAVKQGPMNNQQSTQNKADLTGLLKVEDSYVKSIGVVTPTAAAVTVKPIINDLIATNTAFENANASTGNILDHQDEMKHILNNEQKRLAEKKQSIESAISTQQRMIQLNESYQKRYAYTTKVIIVITIILFLILALSFVSRFFPFIPSFIISTLNIIIIVIGIIYIGRSYMDFSRRSNMNFDEIKINNDPTSLSTPGALSPLASPAASIYDMLSKDFNTCIGERCCSDGTIYNEGKGICVPVSSSSPSVSAFTTIATANAKPLEAFETYGMYK